MNDTTQGRGKASTGAVFLLVLLDMVGFGMIIPSLPFLNQKVGGDPGQLGWIIAAFSIGQFIAAPFMGRLSDRIGRKPVLAGSLVVSVLGNLMYAISPSAFWIGVSRFFAGFAAGNLSVARAYISEVTTPEKRTAAMGMIGAAFGLGFTIGPAIGAFAAPLGLRAPGYIAAGLGLINLVYLWYSVGEPIKSPHASDHSERNYGFILPVLALIAVYSTGIAGFAGFETVGALVTQHLFGWHNRENGWLFAGAGLIAVVVQGGLVRPLSKVFDDRLLMLAGYGLMIAGFAGLVEPEQTVNHFVLFAAILTTGTSLAQPSIFALYSKMAVGHGQGALMGWLHAGGSLARIGGPLWAGYAFTRGGAPEVFSGTAYLLITAVVIVLAMFRLFVRQGTMIRVP